MKKQTDLGVIFHFFRKAAVSTEGPCDHRRLSSMSVSVIAPSPPSPASKHSCQLHSHCHTCYPGTGGGGCPPQLQLRRPALLFSEESGRSSAAHVRAGRTHSVLPHPCIQWQSLQPRLECLPLSALLFLQTGSPLKFDWGSPGRES